jgi:hypothetical protein
MGTRCVITFRDKHGSFSVYQHWDGYPEVVMGNIGTTKNCWKWPRFEADEFAAAYIATHKTEAGNIRLTSGPDAHGDLAYSYDVSVEVIGGKPTLWIAWTDEDGFPEEFIIEPPATVDA